MYIATFLFCLVDDLWPLWTLTALWLHDIGFDVAFHLPTTECIFVFFIHILCIFVLFCITSGYSSELLPFQYDFWLPFVRYCSHSAKQGLYLLWAYHFSPFHCNSLSRNPSATGYSNVFKSILLHRFIPFTRDMSSRLHPTPGHVAAWVSWLTFHRNRPVSLGACANLSSIQAVPRKEPTTCQQCY